MARKKTQSKEIKQSSEPDSYDRDFRFIIEFKMIIIDILRTLMGKKRQYAR